jgi:hypothetical protein
MLIYIYIYMYIYFKSARIIWIKYYFTFVFAKALCDVIFYLEAYTFYGGVLNQVTRVTLECKAADGARVAISFKFIGVKTMNELVVTGDSCFAGLVTSGLGQFDHSDLGATVTAWLLQNSLLWLWTLMAVITKSGNWNVPRGCSIKFTSICLSCYISSASFIFPCVWLERHEVRNSRWSEIRLKCEQIRRFIHRHRWIFCFMLLISLWYSDAIHIRA